LQTKAAGGNDGVGKPFASRSSFNAAWRPPLITSAQIRAARKLLGWKQVDLAKTSGLSETEIKNIEHGLTRPRGSTLDRIQTAFDQAGVVFFAAGEVKDGGPGLRLKDRE
jgi:transcriptional regulator with XRE-family HTH domain